MSKFSYGKNKVIRFLDRNSGHIFTGFSRELKAKIFRKTLVRKLARRFAKIREPEKWIFLVGSYNSGTTIFRRLIESHPDIASLPVEGVNLTDAFPSLEAGGWPRMMYANRGMWSMSEEDGEAIARVAKLDWNHWWPRQTKIFLEKSISHAVRIAWLDKYFKNCYFIFIVRNGYCVSEGILRRSSPQGLAKKRVGDEYPIDMVTNQWVEINKEVQKQSQKVKRFHLIKYEDLMTKPRHQILSVFEFLDLPCPDVKHIDDTIYINGEAHQLINQNSTSFSRISPEDITKMTKGLKPGLKKYGYKILS